MIGIEIFNVHDISLQPPLWGRHTMTNRPAHTQRFSLFEETLVNVHGRFHIVTHAFVMLLGCWGTQRHAGAGNFLLNMHKTFFYVQRLSRNVVKRSQNVI